MDKTFRTLLILFVSAATVLLVVVGVSLRNIKRSQKAADWVNHTHAFITEVNDTIASLRAADGALHTYLLIDDPVRQRAFRDAFAELAEHVEVAKALASSDPEKAQAMADLETLLQGRAQHARALLAAYRSGDSESVQKNLTADADSGDLAAILAAGERLRASLIEQLTQRDREAFESDQTARTTLHLGAALNIIILLGAAWFIRDSLATRRRAAELLSADNERLETRVRERTAELHDANANLKTENLESRWKNQALGHQLRYNHLIIDSINELVIVITKACNISRVNPAVTRAAGLELTALADQPLSDLVQLDSTADDTALVDPIMDSLRTGRDLRDQPARLFNKHQQPIPVSFSLYPLRDNDKIVGGVVTLHLITASSPSA